MYEVGIVTSHVDVKFPMNQHNPRCVTSDVTASNQITRNEKMTKYFTMRPFTNIIVWENQIYYKKNITETRNIGFLLLKDECFYFFNQLGSPLASVTT